MWTKGISRMINSRAASLSVRELQDQQQQPVGIKFKCIMIMCQKCNKRCFISGAKSFCLKVMEFFVVAGVSRQQQQRMTRMTMGLFNCWVTTNHWHCTVVSEVMNRDFREGGIQGDRISVRMMVKSTARKTVAAITKKLKTTPKWCSLKCQHAKRLVATTATSPSTAPTLG